MLYVYIVFVKYVVCLCLYVKTFSQFTTSDNTVPASGMMTAFLPTASSYLVMGIVNNTKEISAVVGGEDSQDPMIIGFWQLSWVRSQTGIPHLSNTPPGFYKFPAVGGVRGNHYQWDTHWDKSFTLDLKFRLGSNHFLPPGSVQCKSTSDCV